MQLSKTKLTLSTFARYMGMHPLHFWQVRLETNPHCDSIMFQHEWQTADHVSREEIARAILAAETKIENELKYRLAPCWEVDEWHGSHRPYQSELVNLNSSDIRGFRQTVRADWGYLISGGIEAKELIQSGVAIVYTDVDGDGYFETATVSVATTAVDKNEICVFYPDEDGADSWEIRDTKVVISAGTATITFKRELAVIPEKLDLYDIEGAEAIGTEDADFLEEVDVYRRYNDPQTQASLLWEPFAGGFCGLCNGLGCGACAYSIQGGCLILRGDPRQSVVGYWPGTWNVDDDVFESEPWAAGRQPDIVRLYYYSGWRGKNESYISRMAPEWESIVAHMAAAMLDRPPCDCAKGDWSRWREDLTLISGDEDGKPFYRQPEGILDNPFGSRRGEVDAWRKVKGMARALAVVT